MLRSYPKIQNSTNSFLLHSYCFWFCLFSFYFVFIVIYSPSWNERDKLRGPFLRFDKLKIN